MSESIKSWLSRRRPQVDAQDSDQEGRGGHCPVCSSDVDAFGAGPNGRPNARCPSCGALERHRFLAVLLKGMASEVAHANQILEVAPTPAVARLLRQASHANYVGFDLDPAADGRSVDVVGDLCAAPFASDSIDLAVCFHVFEHIPNDRAAMSELARILSPSGFAFVQVPWNRLSPTDEDPSASVEERVRRFGQADHIRLYGSDFENRMRASGLEVLRVAVGEILSAEEVTRMALGGTVWIVARAGSAPGVHLDRLKNVLRSRLSETASTHDLDADLMTSLHVLPEVDVSRDVAVTPRCNLCGGSEFKAKGSRENVQCAKCGSLERTRVLKLMLDKNGLPQRGQQMLHLAPEQELSRGFRSVLGEGYDPVDISPKRYPWETVRRFDLTTDAEMLESETYDLILHMHVMEHIRCNVTAVLFHLHRALKNDGFHVFCIPVLRGTYAADLGEISRDRAEREFGQHDHVRRFGADDLGQTLGMVFRLPATYDLTTEFASDILDSANIPTYARTGWSAHNVLVMRKGDIKLEEPR